MNFAFRIKLSTYRVLVKRRKLTVKNMRAKAFVGIDFTFLSFADSNFAHSNFARSNFTRSNFVGSNFEKSSLNVVGIGIQLKIGRYRALLVGKYISVGCVTRRIKDAMKDSTAKTLMSILGAFVFFWLSLSPVSRMNASQSSRPKSASQGPMRYGFSNMITPAALMV